MTRILITGASGLLGANMALEWHSRHELFGMFLRNPLPLPGIVPLSCDLRDAGCLKTVIEEVRPEVVVHAAAVTDVDGCERDPAAAWAVNVQGTENLVRACGQLPRLFCHISTDYVFNGLRGRYTEADAPSPVNAYGQTKLAAERAVMTVRCPWAIIRTSFFGWSPPARRCFMEKALKELESGREVAAWTNRYSTPLLVNDLAKTVETVIATGLCGLWHAGSSTTVSNWQMLRHVAETFGIDSNLVLGSSWTPDPSRAARPLDTSLNARQLARRLQQQPTDFRMAVAHWKQLRDDGYLFAHREAQ